MMDCDTYTKFQHVVSAAKHHGLNVTDYIANCENACIVIFGSGNPDISGIGAIIAFCIQAAAVITSGPLLPVVLFTRYRRWLDPGIQNIDNGTSNGHDETSCMCAECRERLDKPFERVLYTISKRTSGAHLAMAIPLTVAIIVQILQTPPILERVYLEWLVNVQMLMTMILNVSHERHFEIRGKGASWLPIGLCIHGPLTLAATVLSTHSASPINNASELSTACHRLRGTADIMNEQGSFAPLEWTLLPSLFNFCAIIPLGFWQYTPNMTTSQPHAFLKTLRIDDAKLHSLRSVVHHSLTIMVPANLLIAHYAALFRQRRNIQRMAGDGFNDNAWGVGQTMSLIPWIWFIAQLCYDIWKIRYVHIDGFKPAHREKDVEIGSGADMRKSYHPPQRLIGRARTAGNPKFSQKILKMGPSTVGEYLRVRQLVRSPSMQLQPPPHLNPIIGIKGAQESKWRRHQRSSSA